MRPKVTLISHTRVPVRTIHAIWEASKSSRPWEEIEADFNNHTFTHDESHDLFAKLLDMDVPVMENLTFTFLLENVSISLREQLVRHRIGVHVGDAMGVDIIPDLADSSWWSQSMRILDMSQFANNGLYHIPDTIANDPESLVAFTSTMETIADAYTYLVERGIPMEDARELIPLGATSRISWTLNAAALKHIIGKRCCWILQLSVWGDVIQGMIHELEYKVDPIFRRLTAPPCWANGCFTECKFQHDNERRIKGEDEIPPCAVWMKHAQQSALVAVADSMTESYQRGHKSTPWYWEVGKPGHFACTDEKIYDRWIRMCNDYQGLWGDDVTM